MTQTARARKRIQAISVAITLAAMVAAYSTEIANSREENRQVNGRGDATLRSERAGETSGVSSQDDTCAECHRKKGGQEVELYLHSAHARIGLTCNRCHGGDPAATDKQKAHEGRFIGMPSPAEVLSMCSSCHRPQRAAFETGRHFPERQGAPRLDCSQCHGAHLVGSPDRNFSFAYYCAGCHGQEYLPELPKEFQKMLVMLDNLNEATRPFAKAEGAFSEDFVKRRKEVRRLIAEIVHPTNLRGGMEQSAEIVKLGDELIKTLEKK